ncbi:MAG: hypothetical protein HWN65_23110 [Candidatus Helarchaeota archaeon]|nr:hypothetical protein [Candidatus Helarchaeota archaeon]
MSEEPAEPEEHKFPKWFYIRPKAGQIQMVVPKWKQHPVKIFIQLFDMNRENIEISSLTNAERAMLLSFLEEYLKVF